MIKKFQKYLCYQDYEYAGCLFKQGLVYSGTNDNELEGVRVLSDFNSSAFVYFGTEVPNLAEYEPFAFVSRHFTINRLEQSGFTDIHSDSYFKFIDALSDNKGIIIKIYLSNQISRNSIPNDFPLSVSSIYIYILDSEDLSDSHASANIRLNNYPTPIELLFALKALKLDNLVARFLVSL